MNILSLFDGISAAQVALNRADIKIDNYFASEVDKYAIKITQENFPKTIQLGDVREVQARNLPQIDLLIGGSPCQDLSIAGYRKGLQGDRSSLFFEYVRLLNDLKPKYFLLENVASMTKKDKDAITDILKVDPVLINSSLVSAQNRKRLYWSNIEITQPKDKKIILSDVLEYGFSDRLKSHVLTATYGNGGTLRDYFDKHQRQLVFLGYEGKNRTGSRIYSTTGKATTLLQAKTGLYLMDSIASMRTRNVVNGKRKDSDRSNRQQWLEFRQDKKTNCLSTVSKDNLVVPLALKERILAGDFYYRKLTPLECERLQTFPDKYTKVENVKPNKKNPYISNTQRYKALGNSFTVDVIKHILEGIKE